MKTIRLFLTIALMIFLFFSCHKSTVLFQENKSDWLKKGDASWNFSNNELIGKLNKGTGFIMTRKSYKDFVLELDFKPDSTINSGVFIRCKNFEINAADCYEINIWDLHPNQEFRTGAIVTKASPISLVETINKWNTYKIKIERDHLEVWVNGVLTADIRDKALSEGFIGLQAQGMGEIRFRNVKINVLKSI